MQATLTQALTAKHASLAQVLLIQASGEKNIARLLKKEVSKSVTPAKEIVTSDKEVTSEEVPSSIQVVNSHFVNKIKDPCIDKAYKKGQLVVQTHNDNNNFMLT